MNSEPEFAIDSRLYDWIWRDLTSHKCHGPAAAMPSTEDDPCLLVWVGTRDLPLSLEEHSTCLNQFGVIVSKPTRRRDNDQKDGKPPIIRLLQKKKETEHHMGIKVTFVVLPKV